MSFPSVVGTPTTSQMAFNSSWSITLPSGIQVGERIVIVVTAFLTIDPAISGYTRRGDSGSQFMHSFERVATGSDAATMTGGGGTRCSAVAFRVSNSEDPLYSSSVFTSGGSSVADPPNLNPGIGTNDFMWLAAARHGGNGQVADGPPSNYTIVGSIAGHASDFGAGLSVAYRTLNASQENPGQYGTNAGSTYAITLALSGGLLQSIPVGLASETEVARAVSTLVEMSEVETAYAVGIQLSVVGQPEAEVAQAVGIKLSVGVASESEAASTVSVVQGGGGQTISVGVASETEAANAVSVNATRSVAVGVASEVETANAIAVMAVRSIAVGLASEAEVARTLNIILSVQVTNEVETANAVTVQAVRSITVGVASEAELANGVATAATYSLAVGVANEIETGRVIGIGLSVQAAAETETANTISVTSVRSVTVGAASEVEAGQIISIQLSVTAASEVETVNVISPQQGQVVAVGLVTETETANVSDAEIWKYMYPDADLVPL